MTINFVTDIDGVLSYLSLFSETQYSVHVHQYFSAISLVTSRALATWRAWVICNRRWVKIALSCSMVSSLIGAIIERAICFHRLLATGQDYETMSTLLPMILPILATNLVATVAVGHKAWIYHQAGRKSANKPPIQGNAQHVLVLLLESGLLYIVMWVIHIALWFSPSAHLEYAYVDTFVQYMLGMYPAVIIILVTPQTSLPETPARSFLSHSSEDVAESRSIVLNIGFNNQGVHEPELKEVSTSSV
ncbi:hypothetical protein C8J56DRAFT_899673 [Mycena floridula]|nr:hypothetical protein C8J56DRAFT_899673 [Mycena floridula]